MIERLRSLGRRLVDSPGAQLVVGAAILALAFRRRMFGEQEMIDEAKQVVRAYLAGQMHEKR